MTEGTEAEAIEHGLDLLRLERTLGIDFESNLQRRILDNRIALTFFNWIYIWGHWPAIAATLTWLHRTRYAEYLRLRNAMFISGAIGLVIFLSYPVAPPRLLGDAVVEAALMPDVPIDTVTDLSTSYRVLQPPSLVNKYAALPSLHVGWNLLMGLAILRVASRPFLRGIGRLSPIAMMFAVVLTANHYTLDVVAGAAVALVGWGAATAVASRCSVRSSGPFEPDNLAQPLSPGRRRGLVHPYWVRGL